MVGGKSWVSLLLYFAKIHMFVEVNGIKFVPRLRALYDTESFTDLCASVDWYAKAMTVSVLTRVDLMDCSYGGFGILNYFLTLFKGGLSNTLGLSDDAFGTPVECEWKNHVIEYPIYKWDVIGSTEWA